MQDVYRAETVACTLASYLASPNDVLKLDNRACANCIAKPRERVVPDQDFRDLAYNKITTKGLQILWVPGHVNIHETQTYSEYRDAKGNQQCANMGTSLPQTYRTQPETWDIMLHGTQLPTPPRTWLLKLRSQKVIEDVHWTTWLPLKGTRRTTWLPWLWGHARWHDCAAPWERNAVACPLCKKRHGTSVQCRLVQCDAWSDIFLDRWVSWWGSISLQATSWLASADEAQLWKCACLHIPKALVELLPPQEKPLLRRHVALFQFRALQGVQQLREQFVGPTPQSAAISPLWLTPYVRPKPAPVAAPTAKQLREQVHAPWGIKPRRKIPNSVQQLIDIEAWITDAKQANDEEGVRHIHQRPTSGPHLKQQADMRMIALFETHNVFLETHSHRISEVWEAAYHVHTLCIRLETLQYTTHDTASKCKLVKTDFFINSVTVMISYWEVMRFPLLDFHRRRHADLTAFEEMKTLFCTQHLQRLNMGLAHMHQGNRVLNKLTQYAGDCETLALRMKDTMLAEATQAVLQQQKSSQAMTRAWRKRQQQTDLTGQTLKKQRTTQSQDETIVCLTGKECTDDDKDGQNDATCLCGEGSWD